MERYWLGDRLPKDNNFDLIRLFAAVEVVVYHATHHLHATLPAWGDYALQQFRGVPIFFFISGLLVTSSLAGRGNVVKYFERRARRVLPALWVAGGLALVLLGAFGQLSDQLSSPKFWLWLGSQLTVFQVYNPASFRDFGVGVVNGSLWTIPVEISFYLVLPAAVLLSSWSKQPRLTFIAMVLVAMAFSFVAYAFVVIEAGSLPARLVKITLLPHLWLFALGVLAFVYFGTLAAIVRWWPPLFPAIYLIYAFGLRPFLPELVAELLGQGLLSMAVLAVAVAIPPISDRLLRGQDFSYGVYLFHMLVVNAAVELGLGGVPTVLVVVAVTFALAGLSWKYVEKPALAGSFMRTRVEAEIAGHN
ncbi:acyltransferase [Phenylobacterium sp.]|uniref:acyltransferase family protein n=1 Tax=Phenylobacterium sp. TaxID=1871053 RepID=UPI0030F396C3